MNLASADGLQIVYPQAGEPYSDPCIIQRRSWGGGSAMVWTEITEHNMTPLVVVHENLTGIRYRDFITEQTVLLFLNGQQRQNRLIVLQHDNASCAHVARDVTFLQNNKTEVMD